jgi:hypothetical protein
VQPDSRASVAALLSVNSTSVAWAAGRLPIELDGNSFYKAAIRHFDAVPVPSSTIFDRV